jgi:hypothetical protein
MVKSSIFSTSVLCQSSPVLDPVAIDNKYPDLRPARHPLEDRSVVWSFLLAPPSTVVAVAAGRGEGSRQDGVEHQDGRPSLEHRNL